MATGSVSCAPCVFGAVSTNILTYPTPIVGTLSISVVPHITFVNGSSSTFYQTTTITEPGTITGFSPGTATGTIIDITNSDDLTWSTLGTVLTYPTTYVQYVAFQGAAVTASSACANLITPTALSLPASTDPASLVYPIGGTALPVGLLNYLDGIGVPSQLDGDQLTTCAAIGAPPPSSPSPSPSPSPTTSNITSTVTTISSTSTLTSVTTTKVTSTSISSTTIVTTTKNTSPTTIQSSISPLTTITTTPSIITTSEVSVKTNTVTHASARIVQTVTGLPVIVSGGSTSTLPTALPISHGSSASSSSPSSPSGPSIGHLFSIIESLATATVTLTSTIGTSTGLTSTLGTGTGAGYPTNSSSIASSTTASVIPATGAAQRAFRSGWIEWALGLALPLLL